MPNIPSSSESGPLKSAYFPSVGPEVARCWCKKCQAVLLDRDPQVRAGKPWDGPDRPDATVKRTTASSSHKAWEAVCPNCATNAHLEDLTTYGPWRSAPGWQAIDAEAWIANAVETIGSGFHPDTPAGDYDWEILYQGSPWPPSHERAAFEIGLARAHTTLGDRIYEVGLREFQRRGWAPPSPD